MKKLFLIFLALPLFGQTTYTSSKYKPVWYSSTYEKTHGTYALFDTSSIKLYWTTSGKPEWKMIGPTANTLFYVDSTGALKKAVVTDSLRSEGPSIFKGNAIGSMPVTYATTQAVGLSLQNSTAAINGAQQDSPPLKFKGYGWGTTAGTSQSCDWRVYSYQSQSTVPVGTLDFGWSVNGGIYISKFSVNSVGNVTVGKNISASGTITSSIASIGTTSTDGLISQAYTASTTGTRVQYSPRERQTGRVWASGVGADESHSFSEEVIPMSGLTPGSDSTRYAMKFNDSGDGATYLEIAAIYGDGTHATKSGTANGTASFSTDASADTVAISGALATDIYHFEWTSSPGTPGAVWIESKADTVIVHTTEAVTGNPSWCWTRRKTFY